MCVNYNFLTEWKWKWLWVWWWWYSAVHTHAAGATTLWWVCRSCVVSSILCCVFY